jgi:hypothetical protein
MWMIYTIIVVSQNTIEDNITGSAWQIPSCIRLLFSEIAVKVLILIWLGIILDKVQIFGE